MSEQPKLPTETAQQWIKYALGDLRVAKREMKHKDAAYHTVCFLCQGSVEKLLKGYLIGQGWLLRRTHDIVALLAECTEYDDVFNELVADGVVLNEYIISGRYPDDLSVEQIGQTEAVEALKAAHQIKEVVLDVMGMPIKISQGKMTLE